MRNSVSGAETVKRIVSLGKSPRKILVVRSWPVWASTSRLPRNVKGESASTPVPSGGYRFGWRGRGESTERRTARGELKERTEENRRRNTVARSSDDSPLDNPVMHAASAVARGEMEGAQ